jgi:hypothetical protein
MYWRVKVCNYKMFAFSLSLFLFFVLFILLSIYLTDELARLLFPGSSRLRALCLSLSGNAILASQDIQDEVFKHVLPLLTYRPCPPASDSKGGNLIAAKAPPLSFDSKHIEGIRMASRCLVSLCAPQSSFKEKDRETIDQRMAPESVRAVVTRILPCYDSVTALVTNTSDIRLTRALVAVVHALTALAPHVANCLAKLPSAFLSMAQDLARLASSLHRVLTVAATPPSPTPSTNTSIIKPMNSSNSTSKNTFHHLHASTDSASQSQSESEGPSSSGSGTRPRGLGQDEGGAGWGPGHEGYKHENTLEGALQSLRLVPKCLLRHLEKKLRARCVLCAGRVRVSGPAG